MLGIDEVADEALVPGLAIVGASAADPPATARCALLDCDCGDASASSLRPVPAVLLSLGRRSLCTDAETWTVDGINFVLVCGKMRHAIRRSVSQKGWLHAIAAASLAHKKTSASRRREISSAVSVPGLAGFRIALARLLLKDVTVSVNQVVTLAHRYGIDRHADGGSKDIEKHAKRDRNYLHGIATLQYSDLTNPRSGTAKMLREMLEAYGATAVRIDSATGSAVARIVGFTLLEQSTLTETQLASLVGVRSLLLDLDKFCREQAITSARRSAAVDNRHADFIAEPHVVSAERQVLQQRCRPHFLSRMRAMMTQSNAIFDDAYNALVSAGTRSSSNSNASRPPRTVEELETQSTEFLVMLLYTYCHVVGAFSSSHTRLPVVGGRREPGRRISAFTAAADAIAAVDEHAAKELLRMMRLRSSDSTVYRLRIASIKRYVAEAEAQLKAAVAGYDVLFGGGDNVDSNQRVTNQGGCHGAITSVYDRRKYSDMPAAVQAAQEEWDAEHGDLGLHRARGEMSSPGSISHVFGVAEVDLLAAGAGQDHEPAAHDVSAGGAADEDELGAAAEPAHEPHNLAQAWMARCKQTRRESMRRKLRAVLAKRESVRAANQLDGGAERAQADGAVREREDPAERLHGAARVTDADRSIPIGNFIASAFIEKQTHAQADSSPRAPRRVQRPFPICVAFDNHVSTGRSRDVERHVQRALRTIQAVQPEAQRDSFVMLYSCDLQVYDCLEDVRCRNSFVRKHLVPVLGLGHLRWNLQALIVKRFHDAYTVELARQLGLNLKKLGNNNRMQFDVIVHGAQVQLAALVEQFEGSDQFHRLYAEPGASPAAGAAEDKQWMCSETYLDKFMSWCRTNKGQSQDDSAAIATEALFTELLPCIDLYLGTRTHDAELVWSALRAVQHVLLPSSHVRYAKAVPRMLVAQLSASPKVQWATSQALSQSIREGVGVGQAGDEVHEFATIKVAKSAINKYYPTDAQRLEGWIKLRVNTNRLGEGTRKQRSAVERAVCRFSPIRLGHGPRLIRAAREGATSRAAAAAANADVGGASMVNMAFLAETYATSATRSAIYLSSPTRRQKSREGAMARLAEFSAMLGQEEVRIADRAAVHAVEGSEEVFYSLDSSSLRPKRISSAQVESMLSWHEEAQAMSPVQAQLCAQDLFSVEYGERIRRKQSGRLMDFMTSFAQRTTRASVRRPHESLRRLMLVASRIESQVRGLASNEYVWSSEAPPRTKNYGAWMSLWVKELDQALSVIGEAICSVPQGMLPAMVLPLRFQTFTALPFQCTKATTLKRWLAAFDTAMPSVLEVSEAKLTTLASGTTPVSVIYDSVAALYGYVPSESAWKTVFDVIMARMIKNAFLGGDVAHFEPVLAWFCFDDHRHVPHLKELLQRNGSMENASSSSTPARTPPDLSDLDVICISENSTQDWLAMLAHKASRHVVLHGLIEYAAKRINDDAVWNAAGVSKPPNFAAVFEVEHETPLCVSWATTTQVVQPRRSSSAARARRQARRLVTKVSRLDGPEAMRACLEALPAAGSREAGEGETKVARSLCRREAAHVAAALGTRRGYEPNQRMTYVCISDDSDAVYSCVLCVPSDSNGEHEQVWLYRPRTLSMLDVNELRGAVAACDGLTRIENEQRRVELAVLAARSCGSDYVFRTRAFGVKERTVIDRLTSGSAVDALSSVLGADFAVEQFDVEPGSPYAVPSQMLCKLWLGFAAAWSCCAGGKCADGTRQAARTWPVRVAGNHGARHAGAVARPPAGARGHGDEREDGTDVWLRRQVAALQAENANKYQLASTDLVDAVCTAITMNMSTSVSHKDRFIVLPVPAALAYQAERIRFDFLTLRPYQIRLVRSLLWTNEAEAKAHRTWDSSRAVAYGELVGQPLPVAGRGLVTRRRWLKWVSSKRKGGDGSALGIIGLFTAPVVQVGGQDDVAAAGQAADGEEQRLFHIDDENDELADVGEPVGVESDVGMGGDYDVAAEPFVH